MTADPTTQIQTMAHSARIQLTRLNAQKLSEFPEPPDGVPFAETRLDHTDLHRLLKSGVLERVPPENTDRHPDDPNVYRVEPQLYRDACEHAEHRNSLSCCGATGITNVGGELHCKECDAVVTEEEYREVICS